MTKNILQELQGLFFLFSFDGMDVIVRTRICRYGLVGILFFFFLLLLWRRGVVGVQNPKVLFMHVPM